MFVLYSIAKNDFKNFTVGSRIHIHDFLWIRMRKNPDPTGSGYATRQRTGHIIPQYKQYKILCVILSVLRSVKLILGLYHRRRIGTEEKAKAVTVVWGGTST